MLELISSNLRFNLKTDQSSHPLHCPGPSTRIDLGGGGMEEEENGEEVEDEDWDEDENGDEDGPEEINQST